MRATADRPDTIHGARGLSAWGRKMGGRVVRGLHRARPGFRLLACVICFGLAGLIWSLPTLRMRRLRRAASCRTCTTHQRVRNVAVFTVAMLLMAGSLARLQTVIAPQVKCDGNVAASGVSRPEPMLEISPPLPWEVTRSVLVAPASGVGVLAGWGLGMKSCSGPPLLVMSWLPPRTSSGGSTLGDVFLAWMPPRDPNRGAISVNGYGIANQGRYMRHGPNSSQVRVAEAELGHHESRHVDQGAVGTFFAGPFVFPLAYAIDGTFYPRSRNHFERDAGLARGGYPPVDDNWPAADWPRAAGLIAVAALALRRRARWLFRVIFGGRPQASARSPGLCPVHTRGLRPLPLEAAADRRHDRPQPATLCRPPALIRQDQASPSGAAPFIPSGSGPGSASARTSSPGTTDSARCPTEPSPTP